MADEQITPVTGQGDQAPKVDKPAEQQPQTAQTNEEVLTPELRDELRRNNRESREEALRLKKENEVLQKKLEELQKPQENQNGEPYQFSDTDIEVFDKLLDAREKKRQEDLRRQQEQTEAERQKIASEYVTKQNIAINKWTEEHPEYNKIGDPESDRLWQEVQEKLLEYPAPLKPEDWGKLLDRAHKELNSTGTSALERGRALGYAQANLQEQAKLGGGSSGGSSAPTKSKKAPEQQAVHEGFRAVAPQYFQ